MITEHLGDIGTYSEKVRDDRKRLFFTKKATVMVT